jgi:tetratricopeptide (TPR) repeat protein
LAGVGGDIVPPVGAFQLGEESYRVELEASRVVVASAGEERTYAIDRLVGGRDVIYLLTPLEGGRLQVLPIGYDARRNEWFEIASSTVRHFEVTNVAAVDWRAPAYTFNASCYGCHVSHGQHRYDPTQDRLTSSWAEPGISCEACHGPAGSHVRLARSLPPGSQPDDWKIAGLRDLPAERADSLCGTCHGKLTPITNRFAPGERLLDHYDVIGYEDLDFGVDGRDRGENYTYASWRMNRCALEGRMSCIHCHTSSGRYRFTESNANAACLLCHEERVANASAHSRHLPESTGNRCVACHMPRTEFARMSRHDHSLRPPMPALTLAHGSPNACNDCHADRDAAWADARVREWQARDYQAPVLHAAGLIADARRQDWRRMGEMTEWLRSGPREEMFAASLIRLWANCDDDRKWPALIDALSDASPLVRSRAARGLHGYPQAEAIGGLKSLLTDPYRLVRIHAAASLAHAASIDLTAGERAAFEIAAAEFRESLRARGDDAEALHELGHFCLDQGDHAGARAAFERSLQLRPDHLETLISVSTTYYRSGDLSRAERYLRRAVVAAPTSSVPRFNLGVLLERQARLPEAEQAYRQALEFDPDHARAAGRLAELRARGN